MNSGKDHMRFYRYKSVNFLATPVTIRVILAFVSLVLVTIQPAFVLATDDPLPNSNQAQTATPSCASRLTGTAVPAEWQIHSTSNNELLSFLLEPAPSDTYEQTVFYQGLGQDKHIYFTKMRAQNWKSMTQLIPYSFTPQGDPRTPILFMGIELAQLLGFDIRQVDGRVVLRVPSAKILTEKLTAANRFLPREERIGYLPKGSGFLNPDSAIDFSLDTPGDFLLAFPFADQDEVLAVHEVSFHLGAIIYPRQLFSRTRAVNAQIQKFVNQLRSQAHRLSKETAEHMIAQIMRDRMAEIDLGTANPQHIWSHYRRTHKLKSFREIFGTGESRVKRSRDQHLDFISDIEISMIQEAIDLMAQPSYTPLQALILRLSHMTGLQLSDVISPVSLQNYKHYKMSSYGLGFKFDLSSQDEAAFRGIVREFIAQNEEQDKSENYEISNSVLWYNDLLGSLDKNITNLTQALKKASAK